MWAKTYFHVEQGLSMEGWATFRINMYQKSYDRSHPHYSKSYRKSEFKCEFSDGQYLQDGVCVIVFNSVKYIYDKDRSLKDSFMWDLDMLNGTEAIGSIERLRALAQAEVMFYGTMTPKVAKLHGIMVQQQYYHKQGLQKFAMRKRLAITLAKKGIS